MVLDLDQTDQKPQRWLALTGDFKGVELLLVHSGPKDLERFHQLLKKRNVIHVQGENVSIRAGREDDFFRMYAERFILDWRGDISPEGTNYTPEKMGEALGTWGELMRQVRVALEEERDFFPSNGSG